MLLLMTCQYASAVYGYGFLMIIFVSACPLLGVIVVPFIKKNSRFGRFYKYLYSLMIALGASALLSDAVLHLIPEVCKTVVWCMSLSINY